jgi:hypothetical protein
MSELYALGVVLAVGSGTASNMGIVIQKRAVNELSPDKRDDRFLRSLATRRTWIIGLLIQFAIGRVLMFASIAIIGPALVPGLLAVGLIPMAVGAAKIAGESLKKTEILAIILVVFAAILLTASNIAVPVLDPAEFNAMNPLFLTNEGLFTAVFIGIISGFEVAQRKDEKARDIWLAIQAGCFLALGNYWSSPLTVTTVHLATMTLQMPWELVLGIIAGVILVITNFFFIAVTQKAFRSGNASRIIPLQQIPINIAPILVFFWVFSLSPRTPLTVPFLLGAIVLIICSSYLLARRQSQLDDIKLKK